MLSVAWIPASVVLVMLCYGVARLAAAVRNALSLYSAHVDLGRFMRNNESFRAARRSVSRPML